MVIGGYRKSRAREETILSARESYLFRTSPQLLDALRRWARDEFRSLNGQMEFLLRRALQDAGRLSAETKGEDPPAKESTGP